MKQPNAFVKIGAVISSVVLVAGCVGSLSKRTGPATGKPSDASKAPAVMNGSKHAGNVLSLDGEGIEQSTSKK